MNWRLDLMQTNLLPFGGFRKVFITHSFCKCPLYTLQPAKRKKTCAISKKRENMNECLRVCYVNLLSHKIFSFIALPSPNTKKNHPKWDLGSDYFPSLYRKVKDQNPRISEDLTKTFLEWRRDGLETTWRQSWSIFFVVSSPVSTVFWPQEEGPHFNFPLVECGCEERRTMAHLLCAFTLELLVFSVMPFKRDQNQNQNRSINKVQNLGNERS